MLKKFFMLSIELSNHNSTVPTLTGNPDRFISILISCVMVILLFIKKTPRIYRDALMFLFNFYDSPIHCRYYFSDGGAFYSPDPPPSDKSLSSGNVSNRILQLNASYSDAGPDPATISVAVARPKIGRASCREECRSSGDEV